MNFSLPVRLRNGTWKANNDLKSGLLALETSASFWRSGCWGRTIPSSPSLGLTTINRPRNWGSLTSGDFLGLYIRLHINTLRMKRLQHSHLHLTLLSSPALKPPEARPEDFNILSCLLSPLFSLSSHLLSSPLLSSLLSSPLLSFHTFSFQRRRRFL